MSKVSRLRVADVIAEHNLKQGFSKKYSREVAAYLLDSRRTGELESLLRDIQENEAKAGYVEAVAVSAHPLSEKVKTEIKAKVRQVYPKAKRIVISEQHDPTVIGGVRIELANAQLDLSIESKLNKFKQLTSGKDA